MRDNHLLGKMFWSVALPGLGQLLNRKYFKGILLLSLEFLINVQANFNMIILKSFQGKIEEAIHTADYQWLMFYPCMYLYALWDTYYDAHNGDPPKYSFFPFVFAAYFITIGVMYSPVFKISGVLFGPVWLPILFCFIGIAIGQVLQKIFQK
ncbi:hypothetical protein [Alkalihalobacillus sp. AL-G]|uniref:hypothetical protein n=1 Tax=Alkalihalobacillus sp. AL-G TaxID=2926399 RepID=UPI00272AFE8B|nr:hypothetical protein [Alkalihalobacillus sp. AL-G]WLD94592.1 hypothetical protein MOJ78_06825 [Alkalihalobacillus sp. AL-G]